MSETTDTRAPTFVDDSGLGLAMFVIFTVAILFVTGAVAMLALISTWWVLALAFGIHVLMTAAVSFVVFTALGSGDPRPAGRARPSAAGDAEELELPARTRIESGDSYAAAA